MCSPIRLIRPGARTTVAGTVPNRVKKAASMPSTPRECITGDGHGPVGAMGTSAYHPTMGCDRFRAVLFDVGGPIDTEVIHETLVDRDLLAAFATQGIPVTHAALAEASEYAVGAFAPDAYRAIAWRLARGDASLAGRAYEHFREGSAARQRERGGIELRPGIAALLADLAAAGVPLALAANQPVAAVDDLEQAGVLRHFRGTLLSDHHGYRKPDPRLFLAACSSMDVKPERCVMVGDRIDNDIAPARLLGMGTILLRTGRHRRQQPRSWDEAPDHEVADVPELRAALEAWSLLPAAAAP